MLIELIVQKTFRLEILKWVALKINVVKINDLGTNKFVLEHCIYVVNVFIEVHLFKQDINTCNEMKCSSLKTNLPVPEPGE